MQQTLIHTWITDGNQFEISRRKLKRGCFYLGEPFYIEVGRVNQKVLGTPLEILVPSIDFELPFKPSADFSPIKHCYSYSDLDPAHRFEYITFLQEQILPLKSNVALLEFYLRGIAIRFLLDKTTSKVDRLQIFIKLLLFYKSCKKYRSIIEPLLVCLFLNYFVTSKEEITFFTGGESQEEKIILEKLARTFYELFPTAYALESLFWRYNGYSIHSVDRAGCPVVISIPDIINIQDSEIKTQILDAYILFKNEQQRLIDANAEKDKILAYNKNESCAGSYLLFNYSEGDHQSVKVVEAFYKRIIDENEYIITSYDEIIKSFGFKCSAVHFGSPKYSDVFLTKLEKWGLITYPDLRQLDLKILSKTRCVLYRDNSDGHVVKSQTYLTLLAYIKMALYVVQEDEYNRDDVDFIKNVLSKYSPNTKTAKELTSIFLLSLPEIQRLSYIKQEVKTLDVKLVDELVVTLKMLSYVNGDVTRERRGQLECLLPILGYKINNLGEELKQLRSKVIVPKQNNQRAKTGARPISFTLDLSELHRLQEDTAEARHLLSEIFAEESDELSTNVQEPPVMPLLRIILSKPAWPISEIKELCAEYGIMYGAFIENANDYAFSKVDDILLEEDEGMLYVAINYKSEIFSDT